MPTRLHGLDRFGDADDPGARGACAAPFRAASSTRSDLPAALLALDATFVAQGQHGTREIAASEFFQAFLETALAPDELLREIRVPKTGAVGFAFEKFNRRPQDFATVGVVATRTSGGTEPSADLNASVEYREHLARVLVRRALEAL